MFVLHFRMVHSYHYYVKKSDKDFLLNKVYSFRVTSELKSIIEYWVRKYPKRFSSFGEFIRASIVVFDRKLRSED